MDLELLVPHMGHLGKDLLWEEEVDPRQEDREEVVAVVDGVLVVVHLLVREGMLRVGGEREDLHLILLPLPGERSQEEVVIGVWVWVWEEGREGHQERGLVWVYALECNQNSQEEGQRGKQSIGCRNGPLGHIMGPY